LIREKQLSDEVFRITEWGPEEEDKEDLNVWEDNWDDDQAEDDFSVQLK
jgi:26 proteasome complex subunit DSS1